MPMAPHSLSMRLIFALVIALMSTTAFSAERGTIDSKQLESDLQSLNWKQFRSVIESIPKLKADVEAYGPAGWQYVQVRYKTHRWKKNIDRLDEDEKRQLANLIRASRK